MKSRIVVDTNILVRPLLVTPNNLRWIIDKILENELILVTSPQLSKELLKVLKYPRIIKKYQIDETEAKKYTTDLFKIAKKVYPQGVITICRDFKDNMVLETAQLGNTNYIITSDEDLLVLKEFSGIPIITPEKLRKIVAP